MPQIIQRMQFYMNEDIDICVISKDKKVVSRTGDSLPDFNIIIDILNDDEIQVIADNKDNYFKDQGIENMPDIMAKLIKETLSPDDMTRNKDWLHNEIMEQKMWIQIPVNSIRYRYR